MTEPVVGESRDPNVAAVQGTQSGNGGTGVLGIGPANGVIGRCTGDGFSGVFGESKTGPGVSGASTSSVGVDAKTQSGPAALRAIHAGNGPGVIGACHGDGFAGVFGESKTGPGVSGASTSSVGVDAKTQSGPAALRAVHQGGGFAGVFGGHVHVTQNLKIDGVAEFNQHCKVTGDLGVAGNIVLANADCAEDFDIAAAETVAPGMVMVLTDEGLLQPCAMAYDRRVAGVVSGAGSYRPGLVLDRQRSSSGRLPIALLGKVYCQVDATTHPVHIGDLLTTSSLAGHAMKATDPARAFGAVIGKAIGGLESGTGLVPVLVALQ